MLDDGARPQALEPVRPEGADVDPELVGEHGLELVRAGEHLALAPSRPVDEARSGAQRDDPVGVRLLDEQRLDEPRLG